MGMGGKGGGTAVSYEPVKSAEDAMKGASSETARAQELRRGITSTFNRSSMAKPTSTATAGAAAKLGA